MASDRRFATGLAARLLVLVIATLFLVWTLGKEQFGAVRVVAALLWGASIWSIWSQVAATSHEVARFVEAIVHGDLSQRFAGAGRGLSPLGPQMDSAMAGLRQERKRLSDEGSFQAGLVDEVPTSVITIDAEGRVTLANKAARRMFHDVAGMRIEDFAAWGEEFIAHISARDPARYRIAMLVAEGVPQRAVLATAELRRAQGAVRVVSIQPIQNALNAVEVAAQSDLVRVLTHEIMNSMTPVTSLAETAAELMREIDIGNSPPITDARIAVETLFRRAAGIMSFVESYRQYSRPLQVDTRRVDAREWADTIRLLFEAMPAGEASTLAIDVQPADLRIEIDSDLLCQVILNLLKNGAEAAQATGMFPALELGFQALPGARAQITVSDNGPGVPPELRDDVFLPFFTTKSAGTGVGLSLARKIVTAHGGSIRLEASATGGARFVIVL